MLRSPLAPRISLALRSPRLARTVDLIAAAERAYVPEIDLDITGRRFTEPDRSARDVADRGLRVRAIWLPAPANGRFHLSRSPLPDTIGRLADAFDAGSVVVDRPKSRDDHRQAESVKSVKAVLPATTRLVYAIRPASLAGTRDHLAELAAIRRNAEEWDLDLALDLHGPIDPRWEAEAAITKLRSRLMVVRFGPLASRPPGRGRERATARVLATLADGLYDGVIAISPCLSSYRPPTVNALAQSCYETARFIRSRYALVHDAMPDRMQPEYGHQRETRQDGPGWR